MKKILLFAFITGASFSSISQVNWQKGGNSTAGGVNSSFGTNGTWNAPLLFQTFGVNHMKLNGNVSYSVGSIPGVRNGFLLLTNNPTIWTADGGLMNTQTPVFKNPKQQLTY